MRTMQYPQSQALGGTAGEQQAPQQAVAQEPPASFARSLKPIIIAAAITASVCGLCAALVLAVAWRYK